MNNSFTRNQYFSLHMNLLWEKKLRWLRFIWTACASEIFWWFHIAAIGQQFSSVLNLVSIIRISQLISLSFKWWYKRAVDVFMRQFISESCSKCPISVQHCRSSIEVLTENFKYFSRWSLQLSFCYQLCRWSFVPFQMHLNSLGVEKGRIVFAVKNRARMLRVKQKTAIACWWVSDHFM